MYELEFTWDEVKAQTNIKKHEVSFHEAKSAFYDESAIVIYDPDHSQQEDRFILLGMSDYSHLLIVCHCYRENDTIIRIISARKANKLEEKQYRSY
ncbi:MAG: BrnT family toxin [Cyanobacteria bacterium]|nr:BrnT family toxin [Cyanobacteria bacterium CG_2015-16_32_12]NCO77413.1 BrnT family toxin [Cyanobacteria bacterium CG_2015-22_32_23]NCQ04221.1 BrnT family toxin [Cyanobacteria bacterium CG_2015-09_32_10]NCQ42270.1 BrnT family toxin [Cyanobacteria bacterium CG_2015-04_32_10]NCS84760.1 BrnT family toxin [Cyanobacteria bacterium CG_2015-02_32_10]